TERQLHGSLLNMRRVVSRICGALFRGSLTGHEFHRAERTHKLLQRSIQRHQPGQPIAQHLRRVTQSASVPLMCSRERTPARRESPHLFYGDPGD
ncbi:hypothetical protein, partial [Xanthomonas campestris]|uniref:hypothetical protein n=1 Tax=Xanthomonas campestris TaxID=339 RepID=UPI001E332D14